MLIRTATTSFPKNLSEGLEQYRAHLEALGEKSRALMTKTAVDRYATTGLGGPASKKGKSAPKAVGSFLKTQSVEVIKELVEATKKGCDIVLGHDPRGKSKNVHYVNGFVKWAQDHKWMIEESQKEEIKTTNIRLRQPYGKRKYTSGSFSTTNLTTSPKVSLGIKESDYITVGQSRILGNEALHQDLENFSNFLKRKTAFEARRIESIKRLLGYEHRVRKIPLSELSLRKIIPFVKLSFKEEDFADDPDFALDGNGNPLFPDRVEVKLALQEGIAKRRIKKKTQKVLQWIKTHFEWADQQRHSAGEPDGLSEATKHIVLDSLISLTKFIYEDESELNGFSDIPIVKQLRDYRASLTINENKRKSRLRRRMCSWQEAVQVLELQRERTDMRHLDTCKQYRPKPKLLRRRPTAIAMDLQVFLIISLLMLLPTDRQQTFRRLKYVESLPDDIPPKSSFLVYGEWLYEDFIPRKNMKYPKLAEWWLVVFDFKTVDTYGLFIYPIPNQRFRDGKTFYEYIEMWLFGLEDQQGKWLTYFKRKDKEWHTYYNGDHAGWQGYIEQTKDGNLLKKHGWREALKPEHDFVFTMSQTHRSFEDDATSFGKVVRGGFIRFTQDLNTGKVKPVTPHSFRHMLASYTESLELTPAQEKSLAYCDHHSVEMRRGKYTFYQNMRQIKETVELMS